MHADRGVGELQMIRSQLVALVDATLSRYGNDGVVAAIDPLVSRRISWDPSAVPWLSAGDARLLGEVIDALDRLDEGTYGRCAGCGDPIGSELLLEAPATALCPTCASDNSWRPFRAH
jgi:hypothetical protein